MSEQKKVSSNRLGNYVRLFISGHLHVALDTSKLVGFQTWWYNENFQYVEYYFKDGSRMKTEYNSEDLWYEILGVLADLSI